LRGIIVSKFSKKKPGDPVILLVIDKTIEILFENLINSFRLSVGLQMISGGKSSLDLECSQNFFPEGGSKLRSMV
jgi:hypothetical protein